MSELFHHFTTPRLRLPGSNVPRRHRDEDDTRDGPSAEQSQHAVELCGEVGSRPAVDDQEEALPAATQAEGRPDALGSRHVPLVRKVRSEQLPGAPEGEEGANPDRAPVVHANVEDVRVGVS